ncbi:hypothetical protein J2X98_003207 [Pseudarthrobacter enclensis]|uniref:Uncharacterized protein n=1 Tax=Pseudarthrobacter enclensis TaxID=993070 RepID=A0ABT9RWH3_9MICC|nr:hypothetical protein [Pseudarthrobacter enclensis]
MCDFRPGGYWSHAAIPGWVAASLIVTMVFGSVYLTLQHTGRQAVNAAPAAAAAAQAQNIGSEPATGPRLELTKDSGIFVNRGSTSRGSHLCS